MIIYKKLGYYLQNHHMKYSDLQKALNFSPTVTAKFQKNRAINTDTLNKVCEFLKVQPSDIMEWIPDKEYYEKNSEKLALEKQIAELKAKLKEYED